MKNTIISIIVIVLIGVGVYFLINGSSGKISISNDYSGQTSTTTQDGSTATSTESAVKGQTLIGTSVEGRPIVAYHFGEGEKEILFIGGIHGGYEWNTVLVAYEAADYLKSNLDIIPKNLTITVIPVLNPDGLNKVVGTTTRFALSAVPSSQSVQISGRFNASNVDLNRNFDCDWKSTGTWQNTTVSGGSAAFSEPESQAIKQYVEKNKPVAVVAWFSAAGGVYSSSCHNGVSTETSAVAKAYAKASGYPAYNDFDFYAITGDMTNWLAKENITAISVLLTNHTDTEWTKNLAGINALLLHYAK